MLVPGTKMDKDRCSQIISRGAKGQYGVMTLAIRQEWGSMELGGEALRAVWH